MTDGSTFETRSTYGKENAVLQLDIDCKTHPAWTGGGTLINERTGKVAKFKNKFGNIGFGGGAKTEAAEEAKPAAAATEKKAVKPATEKEAKPAKEKKKA